MKRHLSFKVSGAATWWGQLLFNNAAHFFMQSLNGFKRKRVWVELRLVKGLQRKAKCRAMAHQVSPHKYLIQMDSGLGSVAAVRCLAHEFIHINQWLTGKMQDLNGSRFSVRWGKRTYYPGSLAYKKHPWERQAYRYDKALGNSFMRFWRDGK